MAKKKLPTIKVINVPYRAEKAVVGTTVTVHGLADSGARTTSVTGALREPDTTLRPRYDLIPPEERAEISRNTIGAAFNTLEDELTEVLSGNCQHVNASDDLYTALAVIGNAVLVAMGPPLVGWKRLALHYARGAQKYADRNWEKGLETSRTVASLMRHLQAAKEGLEDEDHLAATLWNVIALMFTVRKLRDGSYPAELDTYGLLKRGV